MNQPFDLHAYIELGQYDATSSRIFGEWAKAYKGIRACNYFLENVDKVPSTNTALINQFKGEARALRAYQYLKLTNLYGDVPLVTKAISLEESRALTRVPVAQIWDFVDKELSEASALLPTTYAAADKGRVTKGAAIGLRARANLMAGRYQQAADAADQVMKLGIYGLNDSYEKLFTYAAENNKEVLLDRQFIKDIYPVNVFSYMGPYSQKSANSNFVPMLKELNIDDNTLVMFSSDNGATFNGGVEAAYFKSVGNLRGLKMDVYEGGIREPMLARWPGKIKAGQVTDHVSVQYDLLATLAELTAYKQPFATDGISFLPTLIDQSTRQKQHSFLYWEYPEKGGQLAIRMGNWKAVKTNLRKNRTSAWELYDLALDVSETTNVAAQHPELIRQFDAIVAREHTPTHINEWEIISPKTVPISSN